MSLFWKLTWLLSIFSNGSELETAAAVGEAIVGNVLPVQTWCPEEELTLPSPHYLRHPPQYFPPSPQYPLPKELKSLEDAAQGVPCVPVCRSPGALTEEADKAWPRSSSRFPSKHTQVRFEQPAKMRVTWLTKSAEGRPEYAKTSLQAPARYNFSQGEIYQLKLTDIPRRSDGFTVYPTLEVVPATERTSEFLAHNYVPIVFANEDFDRLVDGQYVVKVIYLPEHGQAGPATITSYHLQNGVNPIEEAQRRGHILAVIRVGNIDLEAVDGLLLRADASRMPPAPVGLSSFLPPPSVRCPTAYSQCP